MLKAEEVLKATDSAGCALNKGQEPQRTGCTDKPDKPGDSFLDVFLRVAAEKGET